MKFVPRIFLSVLLLGLLAGCDFQQLFGIKQTDFDDIEGVNLISAEDFDSGFWEPSEADAILTWESTAITGPQGNENAPVQRLEARNLVTNGDFEASEVGAGLGQLEAWEIANEPDDEDPEQRERVIDSQVLDGKALAVRFSTATTRLYVDLSDSAAFRDADGAISGQHRYLFRYDMVPQTTSFQMQLNDNSGTSADSLNWSISVPRGFSEGQPVAVPGDSVVETGEDGSAATIRPTEFAPDAQEHFLSFGTFVANEQASIQVDIDNFRILRSSSDYTVRLPVERTSPSRPDLVGGTYRFSVWARSDNDGEPNRFPSRWISISIDANVENDVGTHQEVNALTNEWQMFSVRAENLAVNSFEEGVVMTLTLSPVHRTGGWTERDVGSLLVAAPELVFIPEG